MLLNVLKKINDGDLNFTPREMKMVVPYAHLVLYQKPEMVSELIQHVPESRRFHTLGDWLSHAGQVISNEAHTSEKVSAVAKNVLAEMAGADEAEKDLLVEVAPQFFRGFLAFGRGDASKALWEFISDYKGPEWAARNMIQEEDDKLHLNGAFSAAVLSGNLDMAQWILDKVTNDANDPNAVRDLLQHQGNTAFSTALMRGKVERARWVVDKIREQPYGGELLKKKLQGFGEPKPLGFTLAISAGHVECAEYLLELTGEFVGKELQQTMLGNQHYDEFIAVAKRGHRDAMRWLFDQHQKIGGDARIVEVLTDRGAEMLQSLLANGDQESVMNLIALAREKGGNALAEHIVKVESYIREENPNADPISLRLSDCHFQKPRASQSISALLEVAHELGGNERVISVIRDDNFVALRKSQSYEILAKAMELGGKELALEAVKAADDELLSAQFCRFADTETLDKAREVLDLAREIGGEELLQETLGYRRMHGSQEHDPYQQIMLNAILHDHEWNKNDTSASDACEKKLNYADQLLGLLEEMGGREVALESLTGKGNMTFRSVGSLANHANVLDHDAVEGKIKTLSWMLNRAEELGGKAAALNMLEQNYHFQPYPELQNWWKAEIKTRLAEANDPDAQSRYEAALVNRAGYGSAQGHADNYGLAVEAGGVDLLKQCVEKTLSAEQNDCHLRAVDGLLLAGLGHYIPQLGIEWNPEAQAQLEAHQPMPKHALWQEIGSGNERWNAVFNQGAPYPDLTSESPFKFSNKVYQQILPIMKTISEMEDTGMEELGSYKLAVMFASAQEAERYIERAVNDNDGETHQPVHDALLFEIPKNGQWNPQLWKDMLLKFGPAGGKYIGLAPKIEAYLDEQGMEFPKTLQGMNDIASQIVYERANEHPEFARLASQVGLSEPTFEEGLEIIAQKSKTRDNLPEIFIDGADIGHPNYYMEKLPAGDPTGLLLGEFTNCCQHIGDAGRACAIHGFSSENGGFYVWKHKTKGEKTDRDTIVAQSWAWRGNDPRTGEDVLVFDSFERLSKDYNPLMLPFMEQFAHDTQGHSFPGFVSIEKPNVAPADKPMTQVLIGAGGATPKQKDMMTMWPATPVDYAGYRDSKKQYQIAPRQHRKPVSETVQPEKETAPDKVAGWVAREALRQDNTPERGAKRA